MKYNFGSGSKRIKDFTNVDWRKTPFTDIVENVFTNESGKILVGQAQVILATHIFEHCPFDKSIEVLELWKSFLKEGGYILFALPDFDEVVKMYNDQRS